MLFFPEIACRLKRVLPCRCLWLLVALLWCLLVSLLLLVTTLLWRFGLCLFNPPALYRVKVFSFALRVYPLPATQVYRDFYRFTHLVVVQQVALVLRKFYHDVLRVLLVSRNNHFPFPETIRAKGFGFINHLNPSCNFHN